MTERDRKILHLDMDAFYASVEQRDDPALRGRAVIVGGAPASRGVVAACSYEARKFGVHSAMPSVRALRLCPQAILVTPRFAVYRGISAQIREIFHRVTERVEPLALDEAYLDVSTSEQCGGSATRIAALLKDCIRSELELSASAGVSYNKFLAKVASDLRKPDGLFVITPAEGGAFAATLPIKRFPGIGPVAEQRLQRLGIRTGEQLRSLSLDALRPLFGRAAAYYYQASRGIDHRPVEAARETRSISAETTFDTDLTDTGVMREHLAALAARVCASLERQELSAYTVTVKVRYGDFRLVTRSRSSVVALAAGEPLARVLAELLSRTRAGEQPVRLLGVGLSGLVARDGAAEQLPLFD